MPLIDSSCEWEVCEIESYEWNPNTRSKEWEPVPFPLLKKAKPGGDAL